MLLGCSTAQRVWTIVWALSAHNAGLGVRNRLPLGARRWRQPMGLPIAFGSTVYLAAITAEVRRFS